MILAFDFQYLSNNGVLESFLENSVKNTSLSYLFGREGHVVTLYVEGEEEALIAFSEDLSTSLPLSIYFKSSNVRALDAMPENSYTPAPCTLELPFTPKMLTQVLESGGDDFYNPFIQPEIGKKHTAEAPLIVTLDNEKVEAMCDFKVQFERIAEAIKAGKTVQLKTLSGKVTVGALSAESSETLSQHDYTVVPCDLSVVEKMVVIKDNEIKALASLEKPTLKLKVNLLYQAKEILPHKSVKLRLADDMLLFLLCKELFDKGIEFIYLIDKCIDADGMVSFQGSSTRTHIGVTVLENGEILPTYGDAYASLALKENLEKFDAVHHAQFASILKEHALFDEKSCCFYLSERHDDKIMFYSEESGMIDLIGVDVPASIASLFKRITESDETGERLIENYKNAFPEVFAQCEKVTIPASLPKNIYTMFGVAGVVFGFASDVESAAAKLIENAEAFGGTKGPRIDFRLLDESLKSNLDIVRLIRTGISFRLAGTDDMTISYGYLESLSHFVSDTADAFADNLQSSKVGLCGSIFGIKRFSELTARNIKANYSVCFNRELPMDV